MKLLAASCALVVFALTLTVNAAEPIKIELWPSGAPLAKGTADNDKPTITMYVPEGKATDVGVVVCPGGGYGGLAMAHEGKEIAEYYNGLGITAFVLKYRHFGSGGYQHPAPMLDCQRALRTVRARAAEFKLDEHKIGLMGFSAGGHLASTCGTHFDKGDPNAQDPIDKVSCRPDFLVLGYPVVTFGEFTHGGSKKNLLGANPDEKLVENLSNEKQVTAETPPTFLFHTTEDQAVPVENSVYFYLALRKAKVPAEMHIYEKGRHGVGLAMKDPVLSSWSERLTDWLKTRGLLK